MTLRAEWARGKRRWAPLAVALAAACSFQDFEYLQEEDAGSEGGSSGSSGAGTSGASGTSGKGGSNPTGGSSGEDTGGEGGAGASTGGASGSDSGGAGGVVAGMGGMAAGAGGMGGTGGGGSGGMGAIGELVNPSFESSTTSGWTVDPPSSLVSRHIYVQRPTGTVPAPHGTFELATWHMTDGYQVEIYQTVTGLEDGTYTFQGHFSRGPQNEIYMFARDCGGTDPDPFPVPETPTDSFVAVALEGIEVVGGSCEVGLYVDSNLENWMNADLFSLEPE